MSERERIAEVIGCHFAALVSGNNQPHMSGDPRNRLPTHRRRQFDDACAEASRAILAALSVPAQARDWCALIQEELDRNNQLPCRVDEMSEREQAIFRILVSRNGFLQYMHNALAALSVPAQEPVAWRWRRRGWQNWICDPSPEWRKENWNDPDIEFQPLFASPVPAQEWRPIESEGDQDAG